MFDDLLELMKEAKKNEFDEQPKTMKVKRQEEIKGK